MYLGESGTQSRKDSISVMKLLYFDTVRPVKNTKSAFPFKNIFEDLKQTNFPDNGLGYIQIIK